MREASKRRMATDTDSYAFLVYNLFIANEGTTAATKNMAFAKGRTCMMAEVDSLKETIEKMIRFTEDKFEASTVSLKAGIFDLEHDSSLSAEEIRTSAQVYYDELDNISRQKIQSRNKLVICIYSICEAILANICDYYKIPIEHEKATRSKSDYYLTDYLFSIGVDYKTPGSDSYIVYHAIREFRNKLTHSGLKSKDPKKIFDGLVKTGINHITLRAGEIEIEHAECLHQILNICCGMLKTADEIAQRKKMATKLPTAQTKAK